MTNIPYHEHTFVIPTATTEEIAAGLISDKAITPDQLLPVLEALEFSEAMSKLIYDPNNLAADVFDMDNMVEGATNLILTAAERALIASAIQPGGTVTVADDPYDATTWNGSTQVPTKNAVRDKIELLLATTLPASYQPLDSDLTAIAALATASYGRSLLTMANAAALATEVDPYFLTPSEGNAAYQPLDSDLTALAALAATAGMVSRTGAGAFAVRTLTAPAAGITVSNGDGASGNPTLALANDLSAIEALGSTGFAARTTTDTWAQRTLTAPAAGLTISNPAGVAGNPTFALADDLAALEGLGGTGLAVRTATSVWALFPYREVLSANRTYYVRTDGSNSNNGLANTSGGAFATIQKAWDTIVTLDLNGFTVTIKLGNTGTFTSGLNATVPVVGGTVILEGDTTTPANTLVSITSNDAIVLNCVAQLTVQYFEIRTTTSGNGLVSGFAGGRVTIGAGMRFGAVATYQLYAVNGGNISGSANYTISGSAACHMLATLGGTITLASMTVTLSGTPAFSSGFVYATLLAAISAFSITYSGSATGQRYNAALNATINTYGGGASYFPGNSAGATATGGQYA